MDTNGKKKIYVFAKGTKTGIFHSWEKVKACEQKTWSNIQASSVERRELSSYNSTVLTLKKQKTEN